MGSTWLCDHTLEAQERGVERERQMKSAVFWDIKTPVRTSQETHYLSVTESSKLKLCKI
jgi:hypothetical protein